ncbi:hypothetical protein U9M48_008039 [Paspalum notatum var. saurae]|uniref:Uncharacterized protein n=1 Tax=Paspalum notatum var. saurae TaxID=547442 RepID=A0AAQ3WCY9_PASNO
MVSSTGAAAARGAVADPASSSHAGLLRAATLPTPRPPLPASAPRPARARRWDRLLPLGLPPRRHGAPPPPPPPRAAPLPTPRPPPPASARPDDAVCAGVLSSARTVDVGPSALVDPRVGGVLFSPWRCYRCLRRPFRRRSALGPHAAAPVRSVGAASGGPLASCSVLSGCECTHLTPPLPSALSAPLPEGARLLLRTPLRAHTARLHIVILLLLLPLASLLLFPTFSCAPARHSLAARKIGIFAVHGNFFN